MKQYFFLRKTALAVAFSLGSLVASAQAPAIQWDKTFGGSAYDVLQSIIQTPDGGYLMGGTSPSEISIDKSQGKIGGEDFWIVRLNAGGNKIWDKTIGGTNYDFLRNIVPTSDGGYVLGGHSQSNISGDKTEHSKGMYDYWLVKIDSSGNVSWDKTFGGNADDILASCIQTVDGGFLLAGYTQSDSSGDKTQASLGGKDYWLVKLDSGGTKIWDKTFGGSADDILNKLIQTSDGGYIIAGTSASGISGSKTQNSRGLTDYWIVKLDGNGTLLWEKTIGGNSYDEGYTIVQTFDGGFIVGGNSQSGISGEKSQASKGGRDFWISKLDAAGQKIWDRTIGGNLLEFVSEILPASDGSFILAGYSASNISWDRTQPSQGNIDCWLVKINANGSKLWDKTIGGNSEDYAYSFINTTNGGYLLGGVSASGISGNKTQPSRGSLDYWIVKLGPDLTTGITGPTSSFNLTISPNPSQGKFQLQLNNLTAKTATITVSDLVGRTVYRQEIPVSNKQLNQEIYLPKIKGLYLLQINAGGQTTTRKIAIE